MYQKILRIGLLLAVSLLLLAACGGGGEVSPTEEVEIPAVEEPAPAETEEAAPDDTEDTAEADTEDAAPEEESEDIFRIGVLWDTWTADPAQAYAAWAGDLMFRMAYDTLLVMRGFPYEEEMRLAESYEVNDDYTEWTFTLRQDAVFHDGTPVTADDVKYSWDRLNNVFTDLSALWATVGDADSAEVLDEYTIRFTFSSPFADFNAALPFVYIVNADLVRANEVDGDWGEGWLYENEAGSGPFVWETIELDAQHVFVAVDDYWHGWPNTDHMDKIIVKIIPSSSTQKLSLLKGDIDWAGDLEPDDFLSLEGEPGIVTNLRGLNYYMVMMNNQVGPTADVNVRKAIAYAFNYDGMLETVVGEPAEGLIGSDVPGYVPLDMPVYDLEKAREFLAQSEYPEGGFSLDFVYLANYKPDETAALLFKEGLAELNINLEIIPTEWAQYYEICASPETAVMMTGEYSTLYSTAMMLDERYNSVNWGSLSGCSYYKNEEVDRLLLSLKEEPSLEVLAEVQRLVLADMPSLIMFNYGLKEVHTDRLMGLGERHPYPYPAFPEDLYFAD
jgi:peptide/nickel transport system substrate-binding protein